MKRILEDEAKLSPEEREARRKERERQARELAEAEKLRQERELKEQEEYERQRALEEDSTLEDLLGEIGAELEGKSLEKPTSSDTSSSDSISADDFEATMAELQSFINGEVSTSGIMAQPTLEKGIDFSSVSYIPKQTSPPKEEEKVPPFNVYLNYNSFKLEDYAVNHFNQQSSGKMTLRFGKKKSNWNEMLSHTKVFYVENHLNHRNK